MGTSKLMSSGPKDKRKFTEKLKEKYVKKYAKDIKGFGEDKWLFGDAYIKSKLGKRFDSELKSGGITRIRLHKLKGLAEPTNKALKKMNVKIKQHHEKHLHTKIQKKITKIKNMWTK